MKRKMTALLLSSLVLPGLGQLYLGRKTAAAIIIVLINVILLFTIIVLMKALSPIIASKIATGSVGISLSDVTKALEGVSGSGKGLTGAFFLVWAYSVLDIFRKPDEK